MLFKTDSKRILKIKTLCKREISLQCPDVLTVRAVKELICARSIAVRESDIDIISGGKRLPDAVTLEPQKTVAAYVIVRTSSSSLVEVTVTEDGVTRTASFSINMRVSEIKRRLYNEKITKIKPGEARIILNSRVLHDSSLIGDYLINSSPITTRKGTKANQSTVKLYISKTLNLKSDVNVQLELANGKVLRFAMEVGDSLCYVKDILHKQFGFPSDVDTQLYLESGTPLSSSLSLFDYGIKPGTKEVKLRMQVIDPSAPIMPPSVPVVIHLPRVMQQPGIANKVGALMIEVPSIPVVASSSQLRKKPVSPRDGNASPSGMFRGMKKGFLSGGGRANRSTKKK